MIITYFSLKFEHI